MLRRKPHIHRAREREREYLKGVVRMREERVLKQRFWRFLAANIVMASGLNQSVTRNIPALISHEIVPRKTLGRILGSTGKSIVLIYVYAHIQ